ncbi:transcription termination factor [Synechococcus sp. PCC 6312]|nr:transcription termination factor [Synechococcus sp. PCC 6312]
MKWKWWKRPSGEGVVTKNKKMTPTTKEAAIATTAAGKELIISTTETIVTLVKFTFQVCVLTYNLGQDARIEFEKGRHYLNTWLAEQERKNAKLLAAATEVTSSEATTIEDAEVEAEAESEADLNELTLKQLKELAEGLNIENYKRLRKSELIKALEAHKTQTEPQESQGNTDQNEPQTDTQTHPGQSDEPLESQAHHTVVPSYGLVGAPVG